MDCLRDEASAALPGFYIYIYSVVKIATGSLLLNLILWDPIMAEKRIRCNGACFSQPSRHHGAPPNTQYLPQNATWR